MKKIIHMATLILIGFIGALIIKSSFVMVEVNGESMNPTLQSQQRLIGNPWIYNFEEPEKGDIVIFIPNAKFDITYVKRIIATPGDTIGIKDNVTYLNGEALPEPYIYEPMIYTEDIEEYRLLSGEYFVMGDNRNNSSDSRWFGHIRKEQIVGRLIG